MMAPLGVNPSVVTPVRHRSWGFVSFLLIAVPYAAQRTAVTTACCSTGHQDVQTARHDLHQDGAGDISSAQPRHGVCGYDKKKKKEIGWAWWEQSETRSAD